MDSGDFLCLLLSLEMRSVLFMLVLGSGSVRFDWGSAVVPCHVIPSKKVIGLDSRRGRVGWALLVVVGITLIWSWSAIPSGRVRVAPPRVSPRSVIGFGNHNVYISCLLFRAKIAGQLTFMLMLKRT